MKQNSRRVRKLNLQMVFNVLILVAFIIVIVVLAIRSSRVEINDDFFVNRDDRIVITMDKEVASYDDSEYEPPITRVVYQLAGDNVDSVKLYFEYENDSDAKEAFDNISMSEKTWATGKTLNGKYIVFDFAKDQYDGLTAEQVRMFAD